MNKSTVPIEAKFSTADRLNTPEPEPTKAEVLAEALRIVRGETMMLATKKHLVALAELVDDMAEVLDVTGTRLRQAEIITEPDELWQEEHACFGECIARIDEVIAKLPAVTARKQRDA